MAQEPQKNRGSLTVIAAFSVAALLIAIVYQVKKTEERMNERQIVVAPPTFTVPAPEQDTDGDGVPDWQEALIGTDPNNPDSDGDGEKDTYTSISYIQSSITPDIDVRSEDLTPADELSTRLLSEYTSLKQIGAYTEDRGLLIGEKLAGSINQTTSFEPRITDDIQSDSDTSYGRAIAYRLEMQEVFSPLLSLSEAEFVIYGRFIESRDSKALSELLEIADVYESVANDASEIVVPEDALDEHLDVVNSLAFYAATLKEMVRYSYDSVASFALLRTYAQAEEYVFTTFNTLSSYYVLKYREEYEL
ncbi:hypothetical protein COU13_01005 [Candidatus Kaiserbacteria bacterium CG10_big_fil_rev_8_21_14_0_10_43_70]|uniref:Uncharacterized protein n=1 Tax=Candidatus Kaiserbacteria bacterium CG10_big_fil_rev_8_21_14_0_10_43_70 TaxID=1974605 RepID=A0A2H0UJ46_9BACT|nr:MAG: hypothetical protein COU13_01005 [Candidatus Kaiserbacteria bacterium CG10_big_fil_rev_8_21_14_0_10_43_70]